MIDTQELQTITLDYRRECQHDHIDDSLTSSELEGTNGSAAFEKDGPHLTKCLHFLRSSGDSLEVNRSRTK